MCSSFKKPVRHLMPAAMGSFQGCPRGADRPQPADLDSSGGTRLGRPDDGHQCSSGSNQACGPLPDVYQGVILEVDELLRAEVERRLTVGSASGIDDVGAH